MRGPCLLNPATEGQGRGSEVARVQRSAGTHLVRRSTAVAAGLEEAPPRAHPTRL